VSGWCGGLAGADARSLNDMMMILPDDEDDEGVGEDGEATAEETGHA
jgi:hypothetical protein